MNRDELRVKLGQSLTLTLMVNDPDGDAVSVRVVPLPTGASFDDETRTLTWSPTQLGDQVLRFVASDGALESSRTLLVHVVSAEPPRLELPPVPTARWQAQPALERHPRSWESYLLPGVGYSLYTPRGQVPRRLEVIA
jgi:hypothetical protein